MLNGLELLRDTSRRDYHRQVRQILSSQPRRHIRTLLLEFVARQSEPDDDEVQLILPLLQTVDGPLIIARGRECRLVRGNSSGDLAKWMGRPPDEAASLSMFSCAGLKLGRKRFLSFCSGIGHRMQLTTT